MVSELFHNTVHQAHKLQNLQFDLLFKQLAAGVNFNSKVSELKKTKNNSSQFNEKCHKGTAVKKVLFIYFFLASKKSVPSELLNLILLKYIS